MIQDTEPPLLLDLNVNPEADRDTGTLGIETETFISVSRGRDAEGFAERNERLGAADNIDAVAG